MNCKAAPQLILASASPRRADLLRQLGLSFVQAPTGIDESRQPGEAAAALVERLARNKALAGLRAKAEVALPVLAADTLVVSNDQVLGKPHSQDHYRAMFEALSGTRHQVLTAVAVAGRGELRSCVQRSWVTFRSVSRAEVDAYWQTGEPADKAGGYGIQGRAGMFVAHLEGSYSGVMGLPLMETESLLRQAGVDCWRCCQASGGESAS